MAADDDDDWGDFIINSTTLSHTLSLPKPTTPADHDSVPAQPTSAPGRVNPVSTPQHQKQRGALPLSIFGDIEEEQEEEVERSGGGGPLLDDKGASFFANKDMTDHKRKKMNGDLRVNVDDLIANLYKQAEPRNRSTTEFSGSDPHPLGLDSAAKLNKEEVNMSSNWDWMDRNLNNGDVVNKKKLNWNWNPLNSDGNGAELEKQGLDSGLENGKSGDSNLGYGEREEEEEDDGWEFKGAESEKGVDSEVSKTDRSKTENGMLPNLDGFNSSWKPLNLDFSGWNSNVNSSANWLDMGPLPEPRELGIGNNDEWEFKDVPLKTQVQDENFKGDEVKNENKLTSTNSSWDIFGLNGEVVNLNSNGMNFNEKQVNITSTDENEDLEGEDGWEFKAAESESESWATDENAKDNSRSVGNSDGAAYTFGSGNGSHGQGDLFSASRGTSHKSAEWQLSFDFNQAPLTQEGVITNKEYSESKQNDTDTNLYFSPVEVKVGSNENSWAFKDAFSETGTKDKEESKAAEVSTKLDALIFDGEIQEKKTRSDNHEGALPLSIFGDEEKETDDPVINHIISAQMPALKPSDSIKSPQSNISINDLISSLYNQAEQITSLDHTQNLGENGLPSTKTVISSNSANGGDDDFVDDSWEFKDASSGATAEDQTSVLEIGECHTKYSSKKEIADYVDLFSKLKEELHFVALCHRSNLKKAQSAAQGDDAVQALDKVIKDLDNELYRYGMVSGDMHSENQSPSEICLDELTEVLQEPRFHVLESEYQLLKKLPSVENDLISTVELLKLVASTKKILTLLSREGQSYYVSTWSKMLSACAQELKHGAMIWNQLVQKNLHHQTLSKPQGKKYIIALGEIYKIVEVLRSSISLYKPWVLASSMDHMGMLTLISECSTLWSSAGLEDALRSISDPAGFEYDGSIESLLESIEHIHDLDALTLCHHVFSGEDPLCRLSALTAGTLPGMKTVVWNGEYYFLTLANFWANLVSCDPPRLPQIHVG